MYFYGKKRRLSSFQLHSECFMQLMNHPSSTKSDWLHIFYILKGPQNWLCDQVQDFYGIGDLNSSIIEGTISYSLFWFVYWVFRIFITISCIIHEKRCTLAQFKVLMINLSSRCIRHCIARTEMIRLVRTPGKAYCQWFSQTDNYSFQQSPLYCYY